jgi:hypothetical protein
MHTGRIALDEGFEIVREYQHKTHASDGQGAGDAFLRWVLHQLDNPARCDLVKLDSKDTLKKPPHFCVGGHRCGRGQ